ncbi:ABC transporter permease [Cellulophaga fucicola]|uniref:Duplicated orphan permease n=1 Tax=Cellulophaga fucicola TaxID=76595 RepID=A0A1K1Q4C9_9FLAO|nr:ABC transporter permease [Cellulophaga fucicola]SFW53958.1 duplicated orphan permease [Cellulophaga fucicola]
MFKNYFKIAFRSLLKNKGYSFLNIFGLAMGITCASLIFLWVEDEVNYDAVFSNKEQVYYLPTNQKYNGEWRTFTSTPGPLAEALKKEVPGIINATRYRDEERLFKQGDKSLYKKGSYVDSDFLDIFSLEFIQGDANTALEDTDAIILTQKTASQLFGAGNNAVGRTIELDNKYSYTVTGVVVDFPKNVTVNFDWLASFDAYAKDKDYLNAWGNNSVDTYIQLDHKVDAAVVNTTIKKFLQTKMEGNDTYAFMHSMLDWRLRDNFEGGKQVGGRIMYVNLFSVIAWIILIIACINFMNLSTARSAKRANEVGVRKVLGAGRKRLIFQFITESLVIASIATLVSILLVFLLLPQFNTVIEKELIMGISNPLHWLALFGITIFCGVFAGCYPAFYLSSFLPVTVLKGISSNQKGSVFIRKGLVVTQFAASIILIISTIVVYKQVQHVKNRQLGYNKTNLVTMNVRGDMVKNFTAIKQEMLATGMIENTGLNSYNTLSIGNNGSGATWSGMADANSEMLISFRYINPDFLSTAGMDLVDGRNFKQNQELDSTSVIITESFAKLIDTESAVGKDIYFGEDKITVVGVVKDFLYGDMYGKSDPVMFINAPSEAQYMYVRIKQDVDVKNALAGMASIMQKHNSAFPFEYEFVDDAFNQKFKSEMLVGRLSQIFALLAIFISCLGLFGLAAYTSEQRSKEIGVRKVLGASVVNIVNLLSKDFIRLVVLSIVIAIPVAWWAMSSWLEDYAYRINMQWWMFALAGIGAVAIALLTVSFQAIKAAITNPVKSLRTE